MAIRLSSFQWLAVVQLAVGKQRVDERFGAFALEPEAAPDRDGQALAQRTARHLHAGRVAGHAGHRQPAVVATVGFDFLRGNDARLDQRAVERDGEVPVREQEPVALFPVRVVGAIAHGVEIGHGQYIGDIERLGDVALALDFAHQHRIAADAIRSLGELGAIGRYRRTHTLLLYHRRRRSAIRRLAIVVSKVVCSRDGAAFAKAGSSRE